MSNLREAAQAALDKLHAGDLLCEVMAASILNDALAALEAPLLHTFLNEAQKAGVTHLVQPNKTEQEPFAYYNVGISYHTKNKISFHKEPTRNLEDRWWTPDIPLYTAPPDIEALKAERDNAIYACGLVVQRCDRLVIERDALMQAADSYKVVRDTLTERLNVLEAAVKLAIDEMECNQYAVADIAPHADVMAFCQAIETLKKAGVAG